MGCGVWSGFGSGGNPHVAWRLRAAQRVEAAYGPSPNLAVAAVAGSVSVGLADRWSDLELDCYWQQSPSDDDRRRPIRGLDADLEAFWDYDVDEEEWSEEYHLGPLSVTVSNFTLRTAQRFLDAVLSDCDLDPLKHYRLAAIGNGRALRGAQTLDTLPAHDPQVMACATEVSRGRAPEWSPRQR